MEIRHGLLASRDAWLVSRGVPRTLPDTARARLIYQGTHTRIWGYPEHPGIVTKLSLLKSAPRDAFRRYWSSQARRELRATGVMRALGFITPELLGYGVPLQPWRRFDSVLFMRELPRHETLRVFLRRCDDPARRRAVLDAVATGVATIYRAGYHHKDCHLENVLHGDDGRLIWVDSDLRRTDDCTTQARRLTSTLDQLIDTSPDFINEPEWHRFGRVLKAGLSDSAWARGACEPALTHFHDRIAA